MSRSKHIIKWTLLAVVATSALVGILMRNVPVAFSEEQWNASSERVRMARSLVKNEVLIGKTRPEVEEALGKPAYFIDAGWRPGTQSALYGTSDGGRNMQYIVGDAGGIGFLGFSCLYVYLNTNDVVTFCEIGDRGI